MDEPRPDWLLIDDPLVAAILLVAVGACGLAVAIAGLLRALP